ncbi:hypothetical protein F5Y00DRAFT_79517 [Daldinia vernicosa]|uniref:uncharacterized protein n=1 Tax=Daldinia vernicosa TaxID=114800 RepID=UPI002008C163|nr:uncharacterized protein F5Y00DRAFT_79517 [Daldinia vernicosa]KAI0848985.1 hypothetical protein F5Y00DRAFT_79517 [Daldinia vernicosa]
MGTYKVGHIPTQNNPPFLGISIVSRTRQKYLKGSFPTHFIVLPKPTYTNPSSRNQGHLYFNDLPSHIKLVHIKVTRLFIKTPSRLKLSFDYSKPLSVNLSVTMCVKEHQPLVDGCCTFCCKAVDFGTHDYCGNNYACPRCPD